ncbi:MAG TPA: thiolase family protein [Acidimicrobiales bacterium]
MSRGFAARDRVAIAGHHQSPVVRHADRPLGALAVDSARAAVADAGLSLSDVDGVVASSLFPTAGDHEAVDGVSMVSAGWLATHLGIEPSYVSGFQGMGQIPGSVALATNAVASGAAEVLVWQRALHNPRGRYHGSTALEFGGPMQWTAPHGFFGPLPTIALTTTEYFERYGADRRALSAISVEARKNGARIPWSVWAGRPVTTSEYLEAPMVSDPICRLDCDLPVDGVASFVFTSVERARAGPHRPVLVSGYASAIPPRARLPLHWPLDDVYEAGAAMVERLFRHAGIGPDEIDLPQLYDGFSPFVWFWLEVLGLCPVGDAHRAVLDGGIDSDEPGAIPALSGGGALGNGRMHGVPQMLECYLQLAGRAGDRQRGGVEVALACHASPHLGGAVVYRADSG